MNSSSSLPSPLPPPPAPPPPPPSIDSSPSESSASRARPVIPAASSDSFISWHSRPRRSLSVRPGRAPLCERSSSICSRVSAVRWKVRSKFDASDGPLFVASGLDNGGKEEERKRMVYYRPTNCKHGNHSPHVVATLRVKSGSAGATFKQKIGDLYCLACFEMLRPDERLKQPIVEAAKEPCPCGCRTSGVMKKTTKDDEGDVHTEYICQAAYEHYTGSKVLFTTAANRSTITCGFETAPGEYCPTKPTKSHQVMDEPGSIRVYCCALHHKSVISRLERDFPGVDIEEDCNSATCGFIKADGKPCPTQPSCGLSVDEGNATYLCAEHRKKEVTRILASTPFAAIELFQKNRKCGFIAGRAPCTTGATFWLRMHGGPKVWYCSGCRDLAFQALQLEAPGATFDLGDNQRKCQYPLADEGGGLCSIQPSYFLVMNGLNMGIHCVGHRDALFERLKLEHPGAFFELGDNNSKCGFVESGAVAASACGKQPHSHIIYGGVKVKYCADHCSLVVARLSVERDAMDDPPSLTFGSDAAQCQSPGCMFQPHYGTPACARMFCQLHAELYWKEQGTPADERLDSHKKCKLCVSSLAMVGADTCFACSNGILKSERIETHIVNILKATNDYPSSMLFDKRVASGCRRRSDLFCFLLSLLRLSRRRWHSAGEIDEYGHRYYKFSDELKKYYETVDGLDRDAVADATSVAAATKCGIIVVRMNPHDSRLPLAANTAQFNVVFNAVRAGAANDLLDRTDASFAFVYLYPRPLEHMSVLGSFFVGGQSYDVLIPTAAARAFAFDAEPVHGDAVGRRAVDRGGPFASFAEMHGTPSATSGAALAPRTASTPFAAAAVAPGGVSASPRVAAAPPRPASETPLHHHGVLALAHADFYRSPPAPTPKPMKQTQLSFSSARPTTTPGSGGGARAPLLATPQAAVGGSGDPHAHAAFLASNAGRASAGNKRLRAPSEEPPGALGASNLLPAPPPGGHQQRRDPSNLHSLPQCPSPWELGASTTSGALGASASPGVAAEPRRVPAPSGARQAPTVHPVLEGAASVGVTPSGPLFSYSAAPSSVGSTGGAPLRAAELAAPSSGPAPLPVILLSSVVAPLSSVVALLPPAVQEPPLAAPVPLEVQPPADAVAPFPHVAQEPPPADALPLADDEMFITTQPLEDQV